MTDPAKRLAAAERDAAAAKEKLADTVATLQLRLDPKTLARTTVDELSDRGTAAVRTGVAEAKRNPAWVAGAAVLAGVFLARKPIARLFRRDRP